MPTSYNTSVHALILVRHLSWPPLDPWNVNAFSRLREPVKHSCKTTLQKPINRMHLLEMHRHGLKFGRTQNKKRPDPSAQVVYFSPKPSVRDLVQCITNELKVQETIMNISLDWYNYHQILKFTVCFKLAASSCSPIKFARHQSAFVLICLFILWIFQ